MLKSRWISLLMNRLRLSAHNRYQRITQPYRSDLVWPWAHDHITIKLARVCVAAQEQTIDNLAWSQSGADRWYLIWHKACHIKLIHLFWKHSNQYVNLSWINTLCYMATLVLIGYYWPRSTVPSNHRFRNYLPQRFCNQFYWSTG